MSQCTWKHFVYQLVVHNEFKSHVISFTDIKTVAVQKGIEQTFHTDIAYVSKNTWGSVDFYSIRMQDSWERPQIERLPNYGKIHTSSCGITNEPYMSSKYGNVVKTTTTDYRMPRRVNALVSKGKSSLFTKKQHDKWEEIHSRTKNGGCNIISDNASDRLNSYSITLAYLLFLAWRVIG